MIIRRMPALDGLRGVAVLLVVAVVAVALAAASYRWLERPLRQAYARRRAAAYQSEEAPALSGQASAQTLR